MVDLFPARSSSSPEALCTADVGADKMPVCTWFTGDDKEGADEKAECLENKPPQGLKNGVYILFAVMLALGIIPVIKKCCFTTKEYK